MEVLSLEEFKKAIEVIKQFDDENEKLSDILLKDCTGFVDYHFPLIGLTVELLSRVMNDNSEWIDWWLNEDVNKVIYSGNGEYDYDVEKVEDLYYYLTNQDNMIKRIKASDSSM